MTRAPRGAYPKRVKFLGKWWTIEYLSAPIKETKTEIVFAECDEVNSRLRICRRYKGRWLPLEDVWEYILHEMDHAIASDMGIKFPEAFIERHGAALRSVMFDNKWLWFLRRKR